jgi:hypothetical protein
VFLKGIIPVFLIMLWAVAFNQVCVAAPLMVEKNLFSTDRKPPSPESVDASAKAATPGMALGNMQLDGVIFQSSERKAVMRLKNQAAGSAAGKAHSASPYLTVREGQMISDYRVSKIEPKSVLLEKDGQTFTINLFAENKVLSPVAPPVAPQPQQAAPEPEAAPQEVNVNQPGVNPANPQPMAPPNAGGPRNRNRALNPNAQRNVQDPVAEQVQEPNQPAETIEEN